MSTRTDIHRLAEIVPDEYVEIGCFYQGGSEAEMVAYRQDNRRRMEFLQPERLTEQGQRVFVGNHTVKGSCDICGSHFAHGSYYLHLPTGDIIHIGHDCADKFQLASDEWAGRKGTLARKAQAERTRIANIAIRERVLNENPGLAEALELDNPFLSDIKDKFYGRYPELSERQIAAVFRVAKQTVERAAQQAQFEAEATPVVEGKAVVITGTVLSTKEDRGFYGTQLKMLVLDDRNFKVWGTVPSALDYSQEWVSEAGDYNITPAVEKGDRVTFTASVEAKEGETSFGYFKRPRKASFVSRPLPEITNINEWRVALKAIFVAQGTLTVEKLQGLLEVV
jgi:hypothetical protein